MFAGLMDDGAGDDLLKTVNRFYDDWKHCKGIVASSGPVICNSLHSTAYTAQTVEVAKESHFGTSAQLRQLTSEQWSGVTKTKAARMSCNRRMSGAIGWETLVGAGVHAQKTPFSRVNYEGTVIPRGVKDRDISALFRASPKTVTFSGTAPYFSKSPINYGGSGRRRALGSLRRGEGS